MSETSHSIPLVYRHHKDLWKKNKQSLEYEMHKAKIQLIENEDGKASDAEIKLLVGQLAVSVNTE